MTTTVLLSTTFVSTFICSFDFRFPVSFALARMRCTASMTSDCCAKKALPQICRPLDVVCQTLHEIWKPGHGLDTRVPRLLGCGIGKGLVLQILILNEPLLKLHDYSNGYVEAAKTCAKSGSG